MKNIVIIGIQILLVIIWVVTSYFFGDNFNLMKFNIMPIPNFGLMVITFILIAIGYWLQKLKDKK